MLSVLLLLSQLLPPHSLFPEHSSSGCVPGPRIPHGPVAAQVTSPVSSLSTGKEPSSKPSGSSARRPSPSLAHPQLTSHAGIAPASLSEDKEEEKIHQVPRALPDVEGWRTALFGAVAWAEARGDPGSTEPPALPPRVLHLPGSWIAPQGGGGRQPI